MRSMTCIGWMQHMSHADRDAHIYEVLVKAVGLVS